MRLRPFIVLIQLVFFAVVSNTKAQTCTGSLGDPVINETFGSGNEPGPPLPPGVTNFIYTTNPCADDGYYTIINATSICHPDWHIVIQDHTGDPNGFMMLVNASYQPSIFYTQTANGLCPNTTYEFSAYIMNLGTLASLAPNYSHPNITFTVKTKDGTVLQTYNTGTILPTADPTWVKYGTYFVTPSNVDNVIVTMTNNAPGGTGNDLLLDDIAFRACGPIVQTSFGNLATSGDQNVCEGTDLNYTLTSSVGPGYNDPRLQWQSNLNNTGWTNIKGQTGPALNIQVPHAASGTYQYRLAVGEGENINSPSCFVSSAPLTINVNPLPNVSLPATQTVCIGDYLTLGAPSGANYVWTGPNLPPTSQNPLMIGPVTAANAGVYTLTATSDKGCAALPIQTTVQVLPKVVATVSGDATICQGSSAPLSASGGIYYQWTPSDGLDHDDISNPIASPSKTTTYTVKVSNGGCYDDTKSVTVTVLKDPVADAGPSKVIFQGQTARLKGSVSGDMITDFYWSPPDYLDDPHSLTPNATPPHDITYTLNAVSQNCGVATSDVMVRVFQKITIPNAFTPNGDGINDFWNIDALVTYPESLTTVYNRDGQQIFSSIGYAKPWDGTRNGAKVPVGTYYYIIDLKNGTPKISGWVTILR